MLQRISRLAAGIAVITFIVSWAPIVQALKEDKAATVVVVREFSVDSKAAWPYDAKAQGKRVFEHKDTIPAEFFGSSYAGSIGQLAHPFVSKITSRLADAKVF